MPKLKFFSKFMVGGVVVIALWLAQRLAIEEFPGSNSGKGDNLLISD